jgi:hypothetical protein
MIPLPVSQLRQAETVFPPFQCLSPKEEFPGDGIVCDCPEGDSTP